MIILISNEDDNIDPIFIKYPIENSTILNSSLFHISTFDSVQYNFLELQSTLKYPLLDEKFDVNKFDINSEVI